MKNSSVELMNKAIHLKTSHLFLPAKWMLVALTLFTVASCGGGGSSEVVSSQEPTEPTASTGSFRDSIVKGIRYVSTASNGFVREGVTDDGGRYSYYEGGKIDFFVGNILLASVSNPTATTVSAFLAQEPAATNISRFLQTLDEDGDPSNGISIPPAVQTNAMSLDGKKLDFSSTSFGVQFESVKQTLLSSSSIPGSTLLVSSDIANFHSENSSRYALITGTRLGNALEGKLTYPQSYNRDVLKTDEFQRVRQYVWESFTRPKIDAAITLGNGYVGSIDGAHEIVQTTLDGASAVLDAVSLGLSAKDFVARIPGGFATARKAYFSISKLEDVLAPSCSIVGYIADDNPLINSQLDPVQYIRTHLQSSSSLLTVNPEPFCNAYDAVHLGRAIPEDDPRADAANKALGEIFSRTETELWKSANHGWSLKNAFSNGVSLSPIDRAQNAIKVAQIINDMQGATQLSLNTQEVSSLLVARIYFDAWVRSAGDRNFMAKLISGQTGNGSLATTRYEQVDALINFYSSTGVWCDVKTFVKGGLFVGVNDLLSGKKPNYVTCSPNVDRDLINRTIDGAVAEMTVYMRDLSDKIGPFAKSSSATFDLPPTPTCTPSQKLTNGACVTQPPTVSSVTTNAAAVDRPTIFTVIGQNLPLTSVMAIAEATCQTPTNRTTTGFSVVCTMGNLPGSKVVTVKTDLQANGGTVIDASRTVTVSNQLVSSVSDISPPIAMVDVPTQFTVTGVNLPSTAVMAIADATCSAPVINMDTWFTVVCTPHGTAGSKTATIKTNAGGTVIDASRTVTVSTVPTPSATGKLTDTGITAAQCYQAGSDALVSCTSPAAIALNDKQDGMVGLDVINPNATDGNLGFSYSLVPNPAGGTYAKEECVKDNVSGLIWEGKTVTGIRGGHQTYSNFDSIAVAQYWDGAAYVNPTQVQIDATYNVFGYRSAVNVSALCGFTDWRLPTRDELQSLVDYAGASGYVVDSEWSPNVFITIGWTSNGDADGVSNAWTVNFIDGHVERVYRGFGNAVRLVHP